MKWQATEWKKIFSNCISNNGQISKFHKELIINKKRKSDLKIKIWIDIFQRRPTDSQQENVLNDINHQGDENQNHHVILPHTY